MYGDIMRISLGYHKGIIFSEDNPTNRNCFLYKTSPSSPMNRFMGRSSWRPIRGSQSYERFCQFIILDPIQPWITMVTLGVSYEPGNGFCENKSRFWVIFDCALRLLMRRILQTWCNQSEQIRLGYVSIPITTTFRGINIHDYQRRVHVNRRRTTYKVTWPILNHLKSSSSICVKSLSTEVSPCYFTKPS